MQTEKNLTEQVSHSYRATIRLRYMGPTTHRGSRIVVSRFDGKDENRTVVKYDDAYNSDKNYAFALQAYLTAADWDGQWRIGSTTDGAVAVWVGH